MQVLRGRYHLVRPIAQGGLATVWRAEDGVLGVPVAVKVADQGRIARLGRAELLLEEARAMARVRHPGVLRVLDAGEDGHRCFVVTELVEGDSLRGRLQSLGLLATEQVLHIGLRLLDALDAVHAAGLLHLDVKPDNVLLRPDGEPVLADFGLARASHRAGDPGGTPAYMAPEQRRRGCVLSAATDLYALAATLYEALTGHPPDALDEAGAEDPRWALVPDALRELLHGATRPVPAQRPPSARAMAAALALARARGLVPAAPHLPASSQAALEAWRARTLRACRDLRVGAPGAPDELLALARRGEALCQGRPELVAAARAVLAAPPHRLLHAIHALGLLLERGLHTSTELPGAGSGM